MYRFFLPRIQNNYYCQTQNNHKARGENTLSFYGQKYGMVRWTSWSSCCSFTCCFPRLTITASVGVPWLAHLSSTHDNEASSPGSDTTHALQAAGDISIQKEQEGLPLAVADGLQMTCRRDFLLKWPTCCNYSDQWVEDSTQVVLKFTYWLFKPKLNLFFKF